jgi:ribosome modulation factor
MFKTGMKLVLAAVLAATPVVILPTVAQAQQPNTQAAYQAGYNNGVNDRQHNKPLNLTTGNWRGVNLEAYQHGYQDGYRRASASGHYYNNGYGGPAYGGPGYGGPAYGAQNYDTQRAYQAGYNNGVNDRMRNRPLNLSTGNWHGVNLEAYQRGYREGYHGRR